MQVKSRCYRIIYDDDLDTWSVVTTPFNGIYFAEPSRNVSNSCACDGVPFPRLVNQCLGQETMMTFRATYVQWIAAL
ncbi:MAG TPA: hypothetical protein VFR21_21310 [Bradyrhizobium sp.]|jgi:hypothetical protein|nr:hypothetical protein [Bradyrhizobium sp.]